MFYINELQNVLSLEKLFTDVRKCFMAVQMLLIGVYRSKYEKKKAITECMTAVEGFTRELGPKLGQSSTISQTKNSKNVWQVNSIKLEGTFR